MPKLAPPPDVAPETWRALLAAAADFAALAPWEFAYDSDAVGLIDPVTGETRIATVLGNAGEVAYDSDAVVLIDPVAGETRIPTVLGNAGEFFAALFYPRPAGLRWILQ